MNTIEAVLTIASTIAAAAAGLAGALKLLASAITSAMREGQEVLRETRDAAKENTAALKENTAALKLAKGAGLFFLIIAPWLTLSGCVSGPDPLEVRAHERERQIWEEDRRADLDPELIKSREAEFAAHLRYTRSK